MNTISQCRPALGTYVEISIAAEKTDDELLELSIAAFAEIERIEKLMSFHDLESELSAINQNAHIAPMQISDEMAEVLSFAFELSRLTDGKYDISIAPQLVKQGTLPDHVLGLKEYGSWQDIELHEGTVFFTSPLLLDLGGIAKGYAVDKAYEVIPDELECIINAGGDIRMSYWQDQTICVRVPKPEINGPDFLEFSMLDTAVATSSSYFVEQESVIISTETGRAIMDKRSISVFAETCILADALTKVVFVDSNYTKILERYNAQLVIVEANGQYLERGEVWHR